MKKSKISKPIYGSGVFFCRLTMAAFLLIPIVGYSICLAFLLPLSFVFYSFMWLVDWLLYLSISLFPLDFLDNQKIKTKERLDKEWPTIKKGLSIGELISEEIAQLPNIGEASVSFWNWLTEGFDDTIEKPCEAFRGIKCKTLFLTCRFAHFVGGFGLSNHRLHRLHRVLGVINHAKPVAPIISTQHLSGK